MVKLPDKLLEIPAFLRRKKNEDHPGKIKKIQFSVNKGKKVRTQVFREFMGVTLAKEYIEEMTVGDEMIGRSKNGKFTRFKSGITIYSNYSLRKVLKGIVPKRGLLDIKPSAETVVSAPMPKVSETSAMAKRTKIASGALIPLKKLCQELEMEPRKARQMLRAAAGRGEIEHLGKQRWAFSKAQYDEAKKVLDK